MSWYNASWNYRVKVTVDNTKVSANLSNFPVYVDLSDLPAGFHTNVNQTDGRDIRVTSSDGTTELPREVVFYDSATDTGELHFKASSLSSSSDTDFYIYYGNSSATEPATTATYGRNNVWSDYYRVYHLENSMTDSSGNNDGTNYSSTDVTGKIEKGRDFSGSDNQRIEYGAVNKTDDFSLQLWMNPDTVGDSDHRFGGASTVVTGHSVLAFRLANSAVSIWDGSWKTCGKSLSASSWQHVSFNFGVASSGSLTLGTQVDGSDASNVTLTQTTWGLNRDDFNMGGKYATYGNEYDGQMDEFRVSKSVLSADFVKADYANQSSPSTFYSAGTQETNGTDTNSEISATLTGDLSYTRETKATLPTDTTDLSTAYDSTDVSNVASDDGARVGQEATTTGYILHQYKKAHSNNTDDIGISWNGQSTLAPSSNTVYLQIYNHNTSSWDTLDSNSSANADTDFTLSGSKTSNLSYYYSTDKVVSVRVYQEVT